MDWTELRRECPVSKRWVYFGHAAVAPLPERARRTLIEYTDAGIDAIAERVLYLTEYLCERCRRRWGGRAALPGGWHRGQPMGRPAACQPACLQ